MTRNALSIVVLSVSLSAVVSVGINLLGHPGRATAQEAMIDAQSFRLVSEDGRVLAMLSNGSGAGLLTLYDRDGAIRAQVGGDGGLSFSDPQGRIRVSLGAGGGLGYPSLLMLDTDGTLRIVLRQNVQGAPELAFTGSDGVLRKAAPSP